MILNIYEEILEQRGANASQWRPRIEHAQIFAPEDLTRIGKLGGGCTVLHFSNLMSNTLWQS